MFKENYYVKQVYVALDRKALSQHSGPQHYYTTWDIECKLHCKSPQVQKTIQVSYPPPFLATVWKCQT